MHNDYNYNFGSIGKENKPNLLSPKHLKNPKLNQNATQIRCLILHIPFIFGETLEIENFPVWECVTNLLKIIQIIWSTEISENYICELERNTSQFLQNYTKLFGARIKPKLHFLTHYANTIRAVGPIKYLNMLHAERKHKVFTDIQATSKNFKNVTKSLSICHQTMLFNKISKGQVSYTDRILISAKRAPLESANSETINLISEYIHEIEKVALLNFLKLNGTTYRKGFFVFKDNSFYEITQIFSTPDAGYIFICEKYVALCYTKYTNSIEIQNAGTKDIISLKEIRNISYEKKKMFRNQMHIIVSTLDIQIF